jgi:hypothetical protein
VGPGGVSGTIPRALLRTMDLEGSAEQTHGHAESSSRNVRHGKSQDTFLEGSGALTDGTPREGAAGRPRPSDPGKVAISCSDDSLSLSSRS